MDKLLKEAIADAKAVRETALANAKLALEEAFAPKLQSMLAARINEEGEEEETEEEETSEGTGMNPGYMNDEEEEMDEVKAKDDVAAEEAPEEEEDESEDTTDEAFDLDSIIRELEMEAKGEEEEEMDEAKKEEEEEEMDEEIDLQELLASLSEKKGEEEEEEMDEAKKKEEEEEMNELAQVRAELAETRNVVSFLREKINEINLLNAKLLYTNKLFKNYSLTESQKVKILESLDRTKSVREVKLIYSTLAESLTETKDSTKKKITESLGFSSKKAGATKKTIIEEGTTLASRFQHLANINKKK